jgi:SAM-dependent methyltransferase
MNYLRLRVTDDFYVELMATTKVEKVAIVGGSLEDPEVTLIKKEYPNAFLQVFGIDQGEELLDLNKSKIARETFDIVLCTNVIEHVFHHENFAQNLLSLLGEDGFIWCAFPYSDRFHNSPKYYSAGYDPEYLEALFERNGGICQRSHIISSKRGYLFTHLLQDWPTEFRYKQPLLGQILWTLGLTQSPRPPIRNISLNNLIICFYLSTVSKKFGSEKIFGCGGWVKIGLKKS